MRKTLRFYRFRSTQRSRGNNKTGLNVRPPSTKKFSDLNEIWYTGRERGRRVMHDGMPYDPIQGQGQGSPKVAIMADFKVYFLHR